ncbi:hypothetical protein BLA29_008562 [Euroglyphus maynei]|uniref:Uncharacterized protein n=1 Tax=Euroglyphus maynei TaxID=6958 RepID=A0A1Y3BMR6_EURMA|nr:hypothetical protein BLA29_008562 [Euroglyphus maynei]
MPSRIYLEVTRDLTRGQELILYSNQVLLIHEHDICYQNNGNGNRKTGYRYGNVQPENHSFT